MESQEKGLEKLSNNLFLRLTLLLEAIIVNTYQLNVWIGDRMYGSE